MRSGPWFNKKGVYSCRGCNREPGEGHHDTCIFLGFTTDGEVRGAAFALASVAQAVRFGMALTLHHMFVARTYGNKAPDPALLFGRPLVKW